MSARAHRRRLAVIGPAVLLPALVLAAALAPPAARCQQSGGATTSGSAAVSRLRAAALSKILEGEWVGARLLCRKEADNAVRCGKPADFSVTFHRDGTGSSTDEHFPHTFSYRWKSNSEMVLVPRPAGEELTLFQLEIEKGFLSFQAYIYLAVSDPETPTDVSYIHYIFDVHRVE